jgi:hypothetical protein
MSRITKSNVEGLFRHFVKAIGGRVATSYKDVGGYLCEHDSVYGYNIVRVSNENGAQSQPFGSESHSASEIWYMMRFAIAALEEKKNNGGRSGSFRRTSRSSPKRR